MLAILLSAVLLTGMLPITGLAADDEYVFDTIGYTDTGTSTAATVVDPLSSASDRTVVLTLPYSFAGTIDLNTGFTFTLNSAIDAGPIISFSNTTPAFGAAVTVTVTYTKSGGSSESTQYSLTINKAAAVTPTFSGTVSKSASVAFPSAAEDDIQITAADFDALYTANDGGAMTGISITGSGGAIGVLKLFNGTTYDTYTAGTFIPYANIGNLYFDGTSSGTISYQVTAYYSTSDLSNPATGTVTMSVAFTAITAPTINSAIAETVIVGTPYAFTVTDFTSNCSLNNGTLQSVTITPLGTGTGAGTWASGGGSFTAAQINAGALTFTGTASGTVDFSWSVTNEAGTTTGGTGTITVNAVGDPQITGTVTKTIYKSVSYIFTSSDFSGSYDLNYGTLDKITITPTNTSYGTWYLNGTSFTSATDVTSAQLSAGQLKFVSNGTAGSATFTWAVDTVESATPDTSGTGTIAVANATSSIAYTGTSGSAKVFSSSSFTTACSTATGGQTLSYVTFTIPSSLLGTLYSGYTSSSSLGTAITSSTAHYDFSSNIAFMPTSSSAGTYTITYTGYTTSGSSYTGTVVITYSGGTVSVAYTTAANTAKTFSGSDFYTAFYNTTGLTLSYVTFTLPSSYYGTLYQSYSTYGTLYPVSASTPYYYSSSTPLISSVTFMPYTNYTGTVTIYFTGYSTTGASYTGTVTITVGSSTLNVAYTTAANTAKTFSGSDFYTAFYNATGLTLSYVKFTLPSSYYGTLYQSYSTYGTLYPVSASTAYYYTSSSPLISSVTFMPYSNYTGTVTIYFTGYSTTGATYTGTVTITVGTSTLNVAYTTAANTAKTFSGSDFYSAFYNTTGLTLSYVKFTLPSSSYGTLRYGYSSSSSTGSAVSASTAYYYSSSSPYISSVTFVPYTNYTGTVTIYFTAYSTTGASYTGTVTITVGSSTLNVAYTTAANTAKTFSGSDFYSAFYSTTGLTLSYVKFTLPSSSYGTLRYGYSSSSSTGSAVSASTAYYYSSSSPYISSVTFVPYTNYTGTVTIYFTAYSTTGASYTGTVTITVGSSTLNVAYTTAANTAKTFSGSDFYSAFYSTTGLTLSYVKFTLPSSSYGTLRYGYTSSSSTGSAVSASTAYYYSSSSPYISNVTFVPYTNYTGTVTIYFTAYSTTGASYSGTVTITVSGDVDDITLTTYEDTPITFSSYKFTSVFNDASGLTLSYVKFSLPSSSYGKLLYQYTGDTSTSTAVSASTAYYASSSPYLSYVTFLPAANYSGTVTISYKGYDEDGNSASGDIVITVNAVTGSAIFDDVGSNYDWAADAIDYLYQAGIVNGTGTDTYSPSINISRGDFILMLYRALGFSGTPSSMFTDVPTGSYYYNAIAAAKALGIAEGDGDTFRPNDPLTRQDAMVLIYRALNKTGQSLATGSSSDLSGFSDTSKISSYAQTAVATLVKAGIITGSDGQINPLGYMTRAEMAVVIYRII